MSQCGEESSHILKMDWSQNHRHSVQTLLNAAVTLEDTEHPIKSEELWSKSMQGVIMKN